MRLKFCNGFVILSILERALAIKSSSFLENQLEHDIETLHQGDQILQKRAIFPAVLLVIQGMSVSLDIYRTAVGCDGYTPQLKPNIQQANNLQEKLLTLKDQVNLTWVPVYSSKRYIVQLSADVQILYGQIVLLHQLGWILLTLLMKDSMSSVKSQNLFGRIFCWLWLTHWDW